WNKHKRYDFLLYNCYVEVKPELACFLKVLFRDIKDLNISKA
ncbi:unnamed protein product, partial [marine sediment metagenome]